MRAAMQTFVCWSIHMYMCVHMHCQTYTWPNLWVVKATRFLGDVLQMSQIEIRNAFLVPATCLQTIHSSERYERTTRRQLGEELPHILRLSNCYNIFENYAQDSISSKGRYIPRRGLSDISPCSAAAYKEPLGYRRHNFLNTWEDHHPGRWVWCSS